MLIGKSSIEQALNIKIIRDTELETAQRLWARMLDGKADWNTADVPSLRLASSICREISNNATFELEADLTGNETLKEQFMNAVEQMPTVVSLLAGHGSLVLKPFVRGDKILLTIATPDKFGILKQNEIGEITSIVFWDSINTAEDFYTLLELHTWNEPTSDYSIEYKTFHKKQSQGFINMNDLGQEVPLSSVEAWSHLENIYWTNFTEPLFVEVNLQDKQSVFSSAVALIRQADEQYARAIWEQEGGELAVDASIDLFRPTGRADKNGMREVVLPKGKERLFRVGDVAAEHFTMQTFSPELRDQSQFRVLNEICRKIEFACNVGYATISDPQERDKTATEVEKGTSRDKVFIQYIQGKVLDPALRHLAISMNRIGFWYGMFPYATFDIAFEWGDMLASREKQRQQWKEDLAYGVMGPVEYRMRVYGETEEEARKWIPAQDIKSIE